MTVSSFYPFLESQRNAQVEIIVLAMKINLKIQTKKQSLQREIQIF